MQLSLTLRRDLPKVAALYLEGTVDYRVVSAIAWHTQLVQDDAFGPIDAALAEHAAKWGRLYATDAALLKRRLMDMTHGVCDDDPRTMSQRRADALGALAAGTDHLACTCGNSDCPAAGNDGRASNIVIHVVTDASALEAQPDPHMSGGINPPTERPAECRPKQPPAVMMGRGIIPAPLLAELIASGATVRDVRPPGDAPEPGYRPSAALEEFVRIRDLTCRFPGCEEPAEFCDVDHTIPYPVGPTHPSDLTCLKQHLCPHRRFNQAFCW